MHVKKVTVSPRIWKEVPAPRSCSEDPSLPSYLLTWHSQSCSELWSWAEVLGHVSQTSCLICSQGKTEFDLWFSVKLVITMYSVLAEPYCSLGTVQILKWCACWVSCSVCHREAWGSWQHTGQVHVVGYKLITSAFAWAHRLLQASKWVLQ